MFVIPLPSNEDLKNMNWKQAAKYIGFTCVAVLAIGGVKKIARKVL